MKEGSELLEEQADLQNMFIKPVWGTAKCGIVKYITCNLRTVNGQNRMQQSCLK